MAGSRRRAQAVVLFALALPVTIGIVGLALDSILFYDERLQLEALAAGAAAAGANVNTFDGELTLIDVPGAQAAAEAYLSKSTLPLVSSRVDAARTGVRVRLVRVFKPTFLRVLGVGESNIVVEKTKAPRTVL